MHGNELRLFGAKAFPLLKIKSIEEYLYIYYDIVGNEMIYIYILKNKNDNIHKNEVQHIR